MLRHQLAQQRRRLSVQPGPGQGSEAEFKALQSQAETPRAGHTGQITERYQGMNEPESGAAVQPGARSHLGDRQLRMGRVEGAQHCENLTG